MDSKSYHVYEEDVPGIPPRSNVVDLCQPTSAQRRRHSRLVQGLLIATILCLWWSYYAVQGRFEFGKRGAVAHETEVDDGIGFEDFDTVSYSSFSYEEHHEANFPRSPRVRS